MAHEIFISYSAKDRSVANAVCAALESRNIRCWIAPRDVLPGVEYAEALVNAIEGCRLFLLVLSSNSNNSPQVMREVERAVSKDIPVLALRIEDVTLSKSMEFFLSSHHWLDASSGPLERHLEKLADTLQTFLKAQGKERAHPGVLKEEISEQDIGQKAPSAELGQFESQKRGIWRAKILVGWLLGLLLAIFLVIFWPSNKVEEEGISKTLSFQVNYVYRAAGDGPLMPIRDGEVLNSGDHYKVIFTPDEKCYVYIFQIDSSGQLTQIFPMEEFRGVTLNNLNPTKKGWTYILPAPDKSFVLDTKVGRERFYFMAFLERNEGIERLCRDLEEARMKKDKGQEEQAQAGLKGYFQLRGVSAIAMDHPFEVVWGETGDVFSIFGQRLENVCKNCINVIEFVHQ